MKQLYFIEIGTGVDLRGQDITKAAIRAVRDAIGHNTIPAVPMLTGGDFSKLRVHARLAVPVDREKLDVDAVRDSLPVGTATVEVGDGGMVTDNGVGEQIYIVNAAVEVGI